MNIAAIAAYPNQRLARRLLTATDLGHLASRMFAEKAGRIEL
jgi:hypothetical protein